MENEQYKNDVKNKKCVLIQKIKRKGKVMCQQTDMSPGDDHYITMTRNSEPVRPNRSNHKEKKAATSERKKTIFVLGDSMAKHVEGWKSSKNKDRKQSLC